MMHIEKDRVRLAVTATSGKEAICSLLETGALLSDEALDGHGVRRHTATAMTAVAVTSSTMAIEVSRTEHSQLFLKKYGLR